jgi:hypothetical protein
MARILMIIGLLIFLTGALLYFFPGALSWFGRLPGDINIENEQGRLFIPITSMLLISLLLSLILNLFIR